MSVYYYFLNLLRGYKGENDAFLMSLVVNMPFTEEGKILINNLFDLKGYSGMYLVRVSHKG